jgi:hypothetical protein
MTTNERFWGLGKLQKIRRQRKDSSYDNKSLEDKVYEQGWGVGFRDYFKLTGGT